MKKCPFCAEEIQEAAIVCKHCGRDLPRPTTSAAQPVTATKEALARRSPLLFVLRLIGFIAVGFFGILVLFMIVLVIAHRTPSAPTSSVQTPTTSSVDRPRIQLTSIELVRAYEANEVAADQDYKGERAQITGEIERIGKDITNTPYIALKGPGFRSAQAFYTRRDELALSSLEIGRHVTVECRIDGLMMNVLLRDCNLPR